MYSDSTIPTSQFTATSELLARPQDNTSASGEVSPAPVRAMPESEKDWLIQNQVCGGKCSELSLKLDPALWLSKIQKACSSEEVEKSLPLCEWRDIVSKTRSSYRRRKLELGIRETESLSSLSFTTLHSSNTSTNSKPAGLTKCEQSLRKLGIISPSHYLSAMGMELIFGFPLGWTDCLATRTSLSPTLESRAKPKVESEPDTSLPKQSCQDKLTLPSNECSILPKLSESSIENTIEFALSGLGISFGKTLPYLTCKTVTRRSWKDSHAKKFINAFEQNKLIKALDKDIRYGGKQIGWCRLLCAPYKEELAAMPYEDLEAEGGMCSSVAEFVKRYFKGNSSQEVWVIRFELVAMDLLASTNTAELLGIYSDSETKADSNCDITSLAESIHQAQLVGCGVYPDSETKTGSSSPISSVNNSIHQASLAPLGVYSTLEPKTNSNSAFALLIDGIHQALPNHHTVPGVYQNNGKQANTNTPISSSVESIHQSPIPSLGVYSGDGNQSDSNASNDSLAESIHQTPVVQGGSGLVYSFWKGESMVNHYRYKVKADGKWKVKSVYIPVGKLPKVREAITNKLGVAAIVTEVLSRQL